MINFIRRLIDDMEANKISKMITNDFVISPKGKNQNVWFYNDHSYIVSEDLSVIKKYKGNEESELNEDDKFYKILARKAKEIKDLKADTLEQARMK